MRWNNKEILLKIYTMYVVHRQFKNGGGGDNSMAQMPVVCIAEVSPQSDQLKPMIFIIGSRASLL